MNEAVQVAPDARILVINVARIGDTLLTAPILRALKAAIPQGELSCMAHPNRIEVLEGLPFLDHLSAITKNSALWRGWLSPKRWDYALVYGYDEALVRFALRTSRHVIAFEQRNAQLNQCLFRAVARPTRAMHAIEERKILANAIGVALSDPALAYQVSPAEQEQARQWLAGHGAEHLPLLVMHPCSFPTKAYRDWPASSFETIGKQLLARFPELTLLLSGGPDDRARAEELATRLGPRALVMAGRCSLRQTAALLARAKLYVGVDTGMTHLAGALRIPMVAMYHCFHRGAYLAPLNHPRLHVIEHPRTDQDCSRESPMSEISTETVWNAILDLAGDTLGPCTT